MIATGRFQRSIKLYSSPIALDEDDEESPGLIVAGSGDETATYMAVGGAIVEAE